MTNNPLKKHFRQPKIYIKLPSMGKWWPPGSLEMTENGELPVMSMTGKDEMLVKTADALMNGAATTSMIESCLPSIKDAWSTPRIDLDTIMIAIRIATYGPEMSVETKCPHCNHFNGGDIDLRWVMENIKQPDPDPKFVCDDLVLHLKPVDYRAVSMLDQDTYEEQRVIRQLSQEGISTAQRQNILESAVKTLAQKLGMRLAESVSKITTDDGEVVADKAMISDFISNTDKSTFDKIRNIITEYNSGYKIPDMTIKCESCDQTYESKLEFDPANFFAPGS
jgi:hypothetical protein